MTKWIDLKKDYFFSYVKDQESLIGLVTEKDEESLLFRSVFDTHSNESISHNLERVFYNKLPKEFSKIKFLGIYKV